MSEEINVDDEILAEELADDALEKRMRKLESEASRILNQSNELLRSLNKEEPRQGEIKLDE